MHSVTPPDWHPSFYSYHSNEDLGITINDFVDGTANTESETHCVVNTDPNGNQKRVCQDKLGNSVYQDVHSANTTETLITDYDFDTKQRVIRITPPEGNHADLIFEYTYYPNDLTRTIKRPDQQFTEYIYDDRDLETGFQNPVLRAQSKWLVSDNDEYGRVNQVGFSSAVTNVNAPNVNDVIQEYFYDGYDGNSTASGDQYNNRLRTSRIKLLDDITANNTWIETTNDYDACGRIVTSTGINHLTGIETIAQSFDAADNMITQNRTHNGPDGAYLCNKTYEYDHAGRPTNVYMQINGGNNEHLSRTTYTHKDEIDLLEIGIFDSEPLTQMDYLYNAQSWLTQINSPLSGNQDDIPCVGGPVASTNSANTKDLFYMNIRYDNPINDLNTDMYQNGNISAVTWQTPNKQIKGYGFSYDFNDRLTASSYGQINDGIWDNTDFYSTGYSYDQRGNMQTLQRNGRSVERLGNCYVAEQIDDLQYTYAPNSNMMTKIEDSSPCPALVILPETINTDRNFAAQEVRSNHTAIDCRSTVNIYASSKMVVQDSLSIGSDCNTGGQTTVYDTCPTTGNPEGFAQHSDTGQYTYDTAGNMISDPNKNINIYYNYLNLPYKVSTISGVPKELHFQYDANGIKVYQEYFVDGVLVDRRDYVFGIEYKNSIFENMMHEQGRAVKDETGDFLYEYHLRDHLGNTRVRLSDLNGDHTIDPTDDNGDSELLSEQHYYPFGMNAKYLSETYTDQATATKDRYTYNAKELVDELDVNWHFYGFRIYDPAIGRFTTVDPISEYFPHVSTFNYAENEPIANIDLHGLQKVSVNSIGQANINGVSANVGLKANLDIGNNNSFSYSLQIQGVGTYAGSYSKDSGFSQAIYSQTDLPSIGFEIKKKHGIGIPDFLAEYGIGQVKEALAPENFEEAMNLSDEDKQFNNMMTFILNSVSGLIDSDILEASYGYDGSSGVAKKEDGTGYERKFTNVYSGKIDNFSFSEDGISFKGKLLIQYTDQKCTSNCDEKK